MATTFDAYDILGISPDADADAIKKAFRTQSLRHHPDKAQANGGAEHCSAEKFNEIKEAHDILQDEERRKIYDTFGFDLGEEKLEGEVWTIGATVLLQPIGLCFVRTLVTKIVLWLVSFRLIGGLLFILGLIYAVLFGLDCSYQGRNMRDPELINLHLCVGVVTVVVFCQWLWTPLADAVGILYLLTETIGMEVFVADMRVGVVIALITVPVAWFLQGRWLYWVFGSQIAIGIVLLASSVIAVGIMRMWLDRMHTLHSGTVANRRRRLRQERKRLEDENADLKKRAKAAGIAC